MNLCVIPARAGSKGLKDKNVRLLRGKRLIVYTIEAALNCQFFDKIVVTSDSEEIRKIAKAFNVLFLERPGYLAGDDVTLAPVIAHALDNAEVEAVDTFKTVTTLQPTSPLRTASHVKEAFDKFTKERVDSLISVTEELHSVWKVDGGEVKSLYQPKVNRQQAHPIYVCNGAIFISKRSYAHAGIRTGGKLTLYVMDKRSSIDIHTQEDLRLAEWYLQNA